MYIFTKLHDVTPYKIFILKLHINNFGGPDSSVGIATRYGLDGSGIESRLGRVFSASVQTGPGDHQVSCTTATGSFPGVKRPGRGAHHPLPSNAEFEGRLELYICS